jgi:hypothetical protein
MQTTYGYYNARNDKSNKLEWNIQSNKTTANQTNGYCMHLLQLTVNSALLS